MRGLASFAAALLPPEDGGPDPHATAALVERHLAHMPWFARIGLRAGTTALDAVAAATTGHRLATLPPARRAAVLDRVAGLGATAGLAMDGLKSAVLLAHGADTNASEMHATAAASSPARDDPWLAVTPSSDWPARTRADAVVIGSGAGGAVAARTLAQAGLAVLVLEEGSRHGVEEFRTGHPLDRFATLYRDGGSTVALGLPPVMLPIGRAVGGSTVVNSGTCYRPPEKVQRRWRDDHGLTLADPGSFGAHLDAVERLVQVAPVPAGVMGRNGELLLEGAAAFGWRAGPLRRNAPGCGGCCQCAIGCPRNAKFGVHLNALPDACAAGARIVSGARVERIESERGRATGVLATRPDGSRFRVDTALVVVAAGATESPPLLRRSGLGRHPRLGRNLALHPALGAAGRFEEPVHAWRGVLQSAAVEEFHEREGILVEATSTPPGMGSMILPGYGPELLAQLRQAPHIASLGAMISDDGNGRVRGARAAAISYRLPRDDGRRLVRALTIMGRVLFAAGAVEVTTGIPGVAAARSADELDTIAGDLDPRRLHLAAFHPTGTVAGGGDPERHPADAHGRLRGVDGVVVADASLLPSCPEVNPQISIMAMARAAAEHALETA